MKSQLFKCQPFGKANITIKMDFFNFLSEIKDSMNLWPSALLRKKYLRDLRREGLFWFTFQGEIHRGRKPWWQQHKTGWSLGAHTQKAVRRSHLSSFFLFNPGPQPTERCHSRSGRAPHPNLPHLSTLPYRHVRWIMSQSFSVLWSWQSIPVTLKDKR